MNNNQLTFIRLAIYNLKRNYGVQMEIYSLTSSITNLTTGSKNVTKKYHKIRRGIVLPNNLTSEYFKLLGQQIHGAPQPKGERRVIIDMKDYPKDYIVQPNDYAIINHKRFNIKSVDTYEHRLAVLMILTEIKGERPAQIFEQDFINDLELHGKVTYVLN